MRTRTHNTPIVTSDSRYRALVDILTEFVLVTNADGGVVTPQASWANFTGHADDTTAGRGWFDALHPNDRDAFEIDWAQGTAAAEPFAIAGRLLHHSGGYRHCVGRVAPVPGRRGQVSEWIAAFSDVHMRQLAQVRERSMADRYRRIFSANVFGICHGQDQRIVDANDVMLEMLGRTRRDLEAGIPLDGVIVDAGAQTGELGNGEGREFEIRKCDGSTAFLLTAGVSLAPDRGWLAVAVDVTQRKSAELAAEHRSLHDPLTGVANRHLFLDRLRHALARSRRLDTLVAVVFCDLDHFKQINDEHGHQLGDRTLQDVAELLDDSTRDSDTVARFGGDEFVLLLEDLAGPHEAISVTERVRSRLRDRVGFDERAVDVTASFGIALANDDAERAETLLGRADQAMYRAKERGRDRINLEPAPEALDLTSDEECRSGKRIGPE